MSDINLPIIPGQLPSGFCATDYQSLLNAFAANMVAISSSASGAFNNWVFSAAKPADNTVGWYQLDALGRPIRTYIFAQGAWLSLHTLQPGSTIWWFDAVPDLNTFDGGDASVVSAITGPMWQLAKDKNDNVIAAQFPIVAGTLPSGKVLNIGDTGGEESHSLDVTEMPPHVHQTDFNFDPQSGADTDCLVKGITPGKDIVSFNTSSTGGAGSPAVVAPHNTMPLYVVGALLQRTSRLFYAVT